MLSGESNVVVLFLQSVRICPYTRINLFTVSLHENFNPKHYSQCLWLYNLLCWHFGGNLCTTSHYFFFSIVLGIYPFLRSFDPDQNFTPFIGRTCKNYRENAFSWTQRKKIHNSLMNISDVVNAITPFKLMAKPRPHYVFIALPSREPP